MKKIVGITSLLLLLLTGCGNQTDNAFYLEHFHYLRDDGYEKIDFSSKDNLQQYQVEKEDVKLKFHYTKLVMQSGTLYIPGGYKEGRILLATQQKGNIGVREYRFLYLANHKLEMAIARFEFGSSYNEDEKLATLTEKNIEDVTPLFKEWVYNPSMNVAQRK